MRARSVNIHYSADCPPKRNLYQKLEHAAILPTRHGWRRRLAGTVYEAFIEGIRGRVYVCMTAAIIGVSVKTRNVKQVLMSVIRRFPTRDQGADPLLGNMRGRLSLF